MGLYTDEPGRDPAAWEPVAYADAAREIDRMREARGTPHLGEAAERAIVAVTPLCREFADHAGLAGWLDEARAALVEAYRHAALAPLLDLDTDALPGLLEARRELAAAETTGADLTRAELAFRHVLHHHPDAAGAPALAGLARIDAERRRRAARPPPAAAPPPDVTDQHRAAPGVPAWIDVERALGAWMRLHWNEAARSIVKLEPGKPTRVDRLDRYEVRVHTDAHHLRVELSRRDDGWFVEAVAVLT